MPRTPRRIHPGSTYHLISRFVDREWFITTAAERRHYLKLLGRALVTSDWRLLAFAIMSNHIHLAVIAGRQRLDRWIRKVHAPFADAMNVAYDRIGPMFVRGPKAWWVAGDRVGHLIAYIHNNPVRAGVCGRAVASRWTSHRAYVGQAPVPRWLHVAEGLELARVPDTTTFDAWVHHPDRACDERFNDIDHDRLEAERRARREREACYVGSAPHIELADAIARAAASAIEIPVSQLRGRTRGDQEVVARAAAVHYATTRGLTEQAIARALCISQQRVSAVRRCVPSDAIRAVASRIDHSVTRGQCTTSTTCEAERDRPARESPAPLCPRTGHPALAFGASE